MPFSKEYKLFCPSGMTVTACRDGASLTDVHVADRNGAFANVALAPRAPDDPSFAGTVLAPYAGRIPGGRLRVGGRTVQLACNEGENQLHGGAGTLSHRRWACEGLREGADVQEVAFSAEAEDGQDGFPGSRRFTAVYRLYADQRLELTLTAETDRPTRVNLSHHPYFNLSGDFSTDVSGHLLCLRAREVYLTDAAFLAAKRTAPPPALSFVAPRAIGAAHGHAQLEQSRGLNHCYVLFAGDGPAAVLTYPASGRRLSLYTDQPCITVYGGGYLDMPGCAVALEAQEHPESPLAPPPHTLMPGQTYTRRIVYRFDTAGA